MFTDTGKTTKDAVDRTKETVEDWGEHCSPNTECSVLRKIPPSIYDSWKESALQRGASLQDFDDFSGIVDL